LIGIHPERRPECWGLGHKGNDSRPLDQRHQVVGRAPEQHGGNPELHSTDIAGRQQFQGFVATLRNVAF
tara:strand:+ start:2998 stop:3204 length:207 start_codon:yes stop_codon:yes gene_type:complete